MNLVRVLSLVAILLFSGSYGYADTNKNFLPIQEVTNLKYGTPVYGYSTLDLSGPKKFTGKYWGVLENVVGPGHHWIVVELDGAYFKNSGVIAGQSGSPVFVRLKGKEYKIGTVSYGDQYPRNPIAYLTPIEEVTSSAYEGAPSSQGAMESISRVKEMLVKNGFSKLLMDGAVSMGVSAASDKKVTKEDYIKNIKAGSVLSVQLAWGDFDYTGSGTVSHVDGDKVYMFGHPFIQLGPVEYRLVPAKVLGVQASSKSSYIIAAPINDVGAIGTIVQDRETGIYGILGREPQNSIPVHINLVTSNGVNKSFDFNTVSDGLAGPILIGTGITSCVSSWSRAAGDTTLFVTGNIEIDDEKIEFNEAFNSLEALAPAMRDKVGVILTNNYSKAKIKNIVVNVRVFDEIRLLTVEGAMLDSPVLKPGDTVNLKISLAQPRQESKVITLPISIPRDLDDGIGSIVIGNAETINELEKQNSRIVNLATLVKSLSEKRKTDAVYVYLIYPPSRMGSGILEKQDDSFVRKVSKRLSSNVEEYEIFMEDFIVHGKSKLEFKIGSDNGGDSSGHSSGHSEGKK